MNIIKFYMLFSLSISIFYTGCGSDTKLSKTKENNTTLNNTTQNNGTKNNSINNTEEITVKLNAGEDKRVKVNETVRIVGKGSATDGSQLSFTWKKGNDTLATTAIFDYIPTVIGVDTLTLIAQHNSGATLKDSMKVTVVESMVRGEKIPPITKARIKEYLFEINKARAKEQDCGTEGIFPATHPLTWNEKLYKSSYEHTQDLIATQTFSHMGSGTSSDWTGTSLGKESQLKERVETYGYHWQRVGENIGAGTVIDSAKKMVQGWIESDHHCSNLMDSEFKEVGMVMIKDESSKYTHYWTQNFGTQR